MKKLTKIITYVLLVLLIINSYHLRIYSKEDVGNLYALSAALIDGDTGRVLYEKDGNKIRPMASTTKIMTLIVALEYGNPEDIVTVSSYASKMPDVQLGINEGEQYKLGDLYYSLMLESHNDVAVAIAEHIGGDVKGFARLMNAKAKELGLNNTYFITPNGLDESDSNGTHSTTAVDLARLMKYCTMDSPQNEEFKKICTTRDYTFSEYNKANTYSVHNANALLDMMEGVIAGKTGFTADAGYCYVAAIVHDDKTYIVALLGCGWPNNKHYKWEDTKKIIDYAINNYEYANITSQDTVMKQIEVINGTPQSYINTYISEYINIVVSQDEKIEIEYNLPKVIKPPVSKGDIVGSLNILIDNKIYSTINIYSADDIYMKDYRYYINQIIDVLF